MANLRDSLGFLSVNQLLCQTIITEAQKIINYDTVPTIKNTLIDTGSSSMVTRSQTIAAVRQPLVRCRKTEGFSTYAAKLLNALPEKIRKMDTSKPAFKTELKRWIKTYIN